MVLRSSWVLSKGSSKKPWEGGRHGPRLSGALGATDTRRSVKDRGMLLRLPKPLNLKNSGKERGEMNVGLSLAWCDGEVLGWAVHGALCHGAAWC